MPFSLTRIRTLLLDVPRHAKVAYCLFRDERVPMAPKLALAGSLGLIVSPIDFPAWIPVIGELDILALGILAVKVFVEACPEELVREHELALRRGDSVWNRDLSRLVAIARAGGRRAFNRWGRRSAPGRPPASPPELEDRSA